MTVRKTVITDYNQMHELWLSCTGMGLNNLDDSEKGIAAFIARNPDTCFVAEENSQIIGTIMAGNDGRRGYIYHMAVSPDFRNRGVASRLLESVVTELTDLGIAKAALVVYGQNDAGNAFWESQGFKVRTDLVYRDKLLVDVD